MGCPICGPRQHRFVEEPVIWTLHEDERAEAPVQAGRSGLVACSQCSAIRTAGKPCPNCGFMPKRPGEYMAVRDGELQHLDRNGKLHPNHYNDDQKHDFHRMSALGHKRKWCHVRVMSVIPLKADIYQRELDVRFVPKADSVRGVRMPCLAPWRCREVSPSQHRLLGHHQSQEKTPPRQLLRPSG